MTHKNNQAKKIIFDLGAHWGESIEYFSKNILNPHEWDIVSVEASLLNFEKLQQNALRYDTVFSSITTVNAFVYSSDTKIEFFEYTGDTHSAGSTYSKDKVLLNSKKKPEYANLPYNIIYPKIYNFISEYKKSLELYNDILVKMDVEGAEYEILPYLIPILDPNKTKQLYIEFHNKKVNVDKSVDDKYIEDLTKLNINVQEINTLTPGREK